MQNKFGSCYRKYVIQGIEIIPFYNFYTMKGQEHICFCLVLELYTVPAYQHFQYQDSKNPKTKFGSCTKEMVAWGSKVMKKIITIYISFTVGG